METFQDVDVKVQVQMYLKFEVKRFERTPLYHGTPLFYFNNFNFLIR